MAIIHDKSDSYFDNQIKQKINFDPRIPKYVRAKVLYVIKSKEVNNPNFFKIKAVVINNRSLNNFSERPDIFGDIEHLKQNIVLFELSKITIISQDKEITAEPAPGDEISAVLISNEETKNLNVDGYFIRTIKAVETPANENKIQKINKQLKNNYKKNKNSILDTPPTEQERKKYDVIISITSPIDQSINKIKSISEDLQYDFYKNIIIKNGGDFFEENIKRNVLAIRVGDPVEREVSVYNDRMVMLWIDKQGKKNVKTYIANTEPTRIPANSNASQSPINEQFYYLGWPGHPKFKRGFYHSPVKRYDFYKKRTYIPNGSFPSAQHMIHSGGRSATNSDGCQTFPPNEWNRFWNDYYSDAPQEAEIKGYTHQTKKKAIPGKMTYYIIDYKQLDQEIVEEASV